MFYIFMLCAKWNEGGTKKIINQCFNGKVGDERSKGRGQSRGWVINGAILTHVEEGRWILR